MAVLAGQLGAQIIYQVAPGGVIDINPISSILPPGTTRMDIGLTTVPGTVHGSLFRFASFTYEPWGQGFPNPFTVFNSLGTGNENRIFAGQGFHYQANSSATIGSTETIPVTYTDGFSSTSSTIQITIANVFYPVITQQPIQNPQTNPGMTAQLQVAASIPTPPTTGTLTYQWYQGIAPNASNPQSGATTPTFTWNVPGGQALGQYFFWCRVTLVGQGYTASQTGTITVTNQTASVQSMVCSTNPTNAASIQYQLEFNPAGPAVGGLTASNFNLTIGGSLTGANITNVVSGLGGTAVYPTWFITVSTGSGDGTIRLNLNNATGATIGISGLPYTGGTIVTVDKTRPLVSSITRAGSDPTNAAQVSFTVLFSESVTGVSSTNFTFATTGITGATIANVTGSGATRTVTVNTGTGSGTLRLDVTASLSLIVDGAGNQMNVAYNTGQSYTIDKTAPAVSSITRASANPTNAASVDFTVTFTESVSGVVAGNFTFTVTGISGHSITGIAGSGATRTVTVNTGTGTGTLRLNLGSVSPAISDAAGNNVAAVFLTGEVYTIDKTGPVVASITRVGSNPTNAANLDFLVTFDEAATGVDATNFSLAVTGGVTGASITSVSGTGTTRTVTVARGTGEGTIELELSSASPAIADALGNALTATFNSGEAYTVDLTPPGIAISTPSPANTNTGPVNFTVTYTDANNITLATGDITLTGTGGVTGTISIVSVVPNERTVVVSNLVNTGTLGISIAAGTATDSAGNSAPAAGPSAEATVLGGPPSLSISAPSATHTRTGPVTFTVTYGGAAAVTLANGDVTLNTTGTASGTVAVSGTGLTTRTVTISGITGDGTLGISIAADTASNPGGNAPAAGPSGTFIVDNTVPVITAGAALNIFQGATLNGQHAATASDSTSGFNVTIAATTVPTGLTVGAISMDVAGVGTGNVTAALNAPTGAVQVVLTATDESGNVATANWDITVLANAAPTITAIVDQSIAMNGNTGALTFDVDDADEGPSALVVTATSNNQILIDLLTDIVLGGSGANRTITVTPQANYTGVALITLTVTDSNGVGTSTSFTLTVTDTTDAPSLAGLVDLTIVRDTTAGPFVFTATDPQGNGTLGTPAASSLNTSLIPDVNVVFTGTAPDFSFTITPTAAMTGVADITIYIDDGTHTTSLVIRVTVIDPTSSGGGDDDDDDDSCSVNANGSASWMMLLALLGGLAVATRLRRAA